MRHRHGRHLGDTRPPEAGLFQRRLPRQRQGADRALRGRGEVPDHRGHRPAGRDGDRQPRRHQREVRARQPR